jgi:hypothetical protein
VYYLIHQVDHHLYLHHHLILHRLQRNQSDLLRHRRRLKLLLKKLNLIQLFLFH